MNTLPVKNLSLSNTSFGHNFQIKIANDRKAEFIKHLIEHNRYLEENTKIFSEKKNNLNILSVEGLDVQPRLTLQSVAQTLKYITNFFGKNQQKGIEAIENFAKKEEDGAILNLSEWA